MKWFERHLNWAALLISILTIPMILVFTAIAQGFYVILPFDPIYLSQNLKISLPFIVFFSTMLPVICMIWILKKKQRNFAFSSPFICSLILAPILYILNINNGFRYSYKFYDFLYLTIFSLMIIWVTGLIVFLSLKNKTTFTETNDVPSRKKIPMNNYQYLLCFSLIVSILLSSISCISNRTDNRSIYYQNYIESSNLHYASLFFKCPISFHPFYGDHLWKHQGIWETSYNACYLERLEFVPFKINSSFLEMRIIPGTTIQKENFVYKSFLKEEILSDFGENINVDPSTTVIDGYNAEYASFKLEDCRFVRMACFERKSDIWTILLIEEEPSMSDREFDEILDSIRISG